MCLQDRQAERAALQKQVEASRVGKEDSVSACFAGCNRTIGCWAVGLLNAQLCASAPNVLGFKAESRRCNQQAAASGLACTPQPHVVQPSYQSEGLPPSVRPPLCYCVTAYCSRLPQEERRALQQQAAQLQAAVEAQAAELAEYAGNDPDRYDNLSEF